MTINKKSRQNKKWVVSLFLLTALLILAFFPLPQQPPIQYIDRASGEVKTEKVAGENWLVWLYNNPVGEATLWALAKRKMVSSVYGEIMDRSSSAKKIQPFVEAFGIDLGEAQKQQFHSFNDFFTRKLKAGARPVDTVSNVVASPADGKILAYANLANSDFIVKGYRFDVYSFLDDSVLARKYENGSLIIIRLAPNDYHRFHFPLGGKLSPLHRISGEYYSVNPIALGKMAEIFCLNKREFVLIANPVFGDVVMMEVGATMVGSIVQTYRDNIAIKGAEKGYFKFGGSTVVLLFEKGKIFIDDDLLLNTSKGYETSILVRQRIGISTQSINSLPL